VAPSLAGGDGVGAGGHASAAHRPRVAVGQRGAFQRVDDAAQGVLLLAAAGQPDVVVAQLPPGARGERLAALVDQRCGAGPLGLQLGFR
jgi:hypothetical protein